MSEAGASSSAGKEFAAALLLSGAAGFADALGYMADGVFAANMTGNTVLASMALTEGCCMLAAERFGTLIAFFVGAMTARAVLHWKRSSASWALMVEAVVLLAATAGGIDTFVGLQTVALAMGVQAAAMTRFAGVPISTVVITSTLSRIAESTVDRGARLIGATPSPDRHNLRLLVSAWLSYAIGAAAAVGAVALIGRSRFTLLVPTAAVVAVALLLRKSRR